MLALLWSMSGSGFVTDAFVIASSACQSMFDCVPVATYQGMMNALVQWTDRFMEVLFKPLQFSMQAIGGAFYCVFGYVPIAFDGSRATVPRTAANEKEFCAKNYGNGEYAKATKRKGTKVKRNEHGTAHPQEPQIWITMLWHMGLRLPWRWKLGRSDSSEQKLWKTQMIAFYKMRWGIEIEFRGLKQTLDCAKMCCLNPSRSLVELNWSIAAMAVSELLAMREQLRVQSQKRGKSKSIWTPQRRGLAQTMRAIRIAINKPDIRPKFGSDLTTKLEQALTDAYKRRASKQARLQPRPNKKPLKPPIVIVLNSKERSKIEKLDYKIAA